LIILSGLNTGWIFPSTIYPALLLWTKYWGQVTFIKYFALGYSPFSDERYLFKPLCSVITPNDKKK